MANVRYQLIRPRGPPANEDSIRRSPAKVFLCCALLLLIVVYHQSKYSGIELPDAPAINGSKPTTKPIKVFNSIAEPSQSGLFVNTPICRMPAINPFEADVARIYHKIAYKPCADDKDLIQVAYADGVYRLHMTKPDITCCYKPILRSGVGADADKEYKLLPCSKFHQDFTVPQHVDGIITECRRLDDNKVLQRSAFGFVQPINPATTRKSTPRRPSVLLWGIDSLSRMNFQRNMPLMYKYLRERSWYELQGYNKMGDNTFPNLMAALTGFNETRAQSVCQPKNVGGLDGCPMMWKRFKEHDYVTGYGEDWSRYSTFNYQMSGFQNPPTDYYARPLILAAEKELDKKSNMAIPYCVGRRHFAEYIYDGALQFTEVYRNQSSFGLFWANSFSHNNFAMPSSMDARLVEYMESLQRNGAFDNSIIFFFSDHGMRFGLLRQLKNGYLEERMPIMYIWLPKWLREKYPEYVRALTLNRNRLSSPYDIYATLRHILELDTPREKLPRPEGCATCHSLFHELKLNSIESVQQRILPGAKRTNSYLVRYETQPAKALFEATVKWNDTSQTISVSVPSISRLTTYKEHSECVDRPGPKRYCICVN